MTTLRIVRTHEVRDWFAQSADLADFTRGIGEAVAREELGIALELPEHLVYAVDGLARESDGPVPQEALSSIPFFSLCRGLFVPLSGLDTARASQLFGIALRDEPRKSADLAREFLAKDCGLSLKWKIGCLLGDPFGRSGGMRRDSLVRLLRSMSMVSRTAVLDRLTQVGDVAVLFAESTPQLRGEPALTALEVLETLRLLAGERATRRYSVLRAIMARCGRMERFFLARLLLRKAGFGFDYQGNLIAQLLAEKAGADADAVAGAMALTSPTEVAEILEREGAAGLRRVQLQPLSPVRPALAGGSTDEIEKFPVWVERKYDGIRLHLHKSTDARGAVLCGAYTRNRGDWLENIPGLAQSIRMLPARNAIVDGELYGTVVDLDGVRPASVYEVYATIQGEPARPVQLKFAAFDLVYCNGADLTALPLHARRAQLQMLVTPLAGMPLPLPVSLADGQMAESAGDVNKLFQHFRAQGYEGIVAKDWNGTYKLATRDPAWFKRKPEITLDLVLLGGVLAVTTKETAGTFGSYVIGARNPKGGFDIVGDVAGVDKVRDAQIQGEVMKRGLLTGRRIERASSSGVRPGLEFSAGLVVTVRFEGIIRAERTGELTLRDPKLVYIRSDKSAFECDEVAMLEKLYLSQRMG